MTAASAAPRASAAGLVCVCGSWRFIVPLGEKVRIVEYDVTPPPPLSQPWLGGLAWVDNTALASLRLVATGAPPKGSRRTSAVLIDNGSGEMAWAIEVDKASSLVHLDAAQPVGTTAPQLICPPHWLKPSGSETDGGPLWLDLAAVRQTLAHHAFVGATDSQAVT